LESAQDATKITVSGQADLDRNLIFNLRMAFVQTLQSKAIRDLAKENLAYYDHVLDLSNERYKAGGIAKIDLSRLQLQRVQYESDLQTAEVNLRTAKIFISSGASAIGIGKELIPIDAIELRKSDRIEELAYRFKKIVLEARAGVEARKTRAAVRKDVGTEQCKA
jgi:outer membrane protein TolC